MASMEMVCVDNSALIDAGLITGYRVPLYTSFRRPVCADVDLKKKVEEEWCKRTLTGEYAALGNNIYLRNITDIQTFVEGGMKNHINEYHYYTAMIIKDPNISIILSHFNSGVKSDGVGRVMYPADAYISNQYACKRIIVSCDFVHDCFVMYGSDITSPRCMEFLVPHDGADGDPNLMALAYHLWWANGGPRSIARDLYKPIPGSLCCVPDFGPAEDLPHVVRYRIALKTDMQNPQWGGAAQSELKNPVELQLYKMVGSWPRKVSAKLVEASTYMCEARFILWDAAHEFPGSTDLMPWSNLILISKNGTVGTPRRADETGVRAWDMVGDLRIVDDYRVRVLGASSRMDLVGRRPEPRAIPRSVPAKGNHLEWDASWNKLSLDDFRKFKYKPGDVMGCTSISKNKCANKTNGRYSICGWCYNEDASYRGQKCLRKMVLMPFVVGIGAEINDDEEEEEEEDGDDEEEEEEEEEDGDDEGAALEFFATPAVLTGESEDAETETETETGSADFHRRATEARGSKFARIAPVDLHARTHEATPLHMDVAPANIWLYPFFKSVEKMEISSHFRDSTAGVFLYPLLPLRKRVDDVITYDWWCPRSKHGVGAGVHHLELFQPWEPVRVSDVQVAGVRPPVEELRHGSPETSHRSVHIWPADAQCVQETMDEADLASSGHGYVWVPPFYRREEISVYQRVWNNPTHQSVSCVQLNAPHGRYFFSPFGSGVKSGVLACQNTGHVSCIVRIEWDGSMYTLTHSWAKLDNALGLSNVHSDYDSALDNMADAVTDLARDVFSARPGSNVDWIRSKKLIQTHVIKWGLICDNMNTTDDKTLIRVYKALIDIASNLEVAASKNPNKSREGNTDTVNQILELWKRFPEGSDKSNENAMTNLVREAIINNATKNEKVYVMRHEDDKKTIKVGKSAAAKRKKAKKEAAAKRKKAKGSSAKSNKKIKVSELDEKDDSKIDLSPGLWQILNGP